MKKVKRSKKKYTIKTKSRMFIFFLVFGVSIFTLGYRLLINLYQINYMNEQKKVLEHEIDVLSEEKDVLEADIEKLSNPDYIAKYVREKYLYSKSGELIIRFEK